LNIGSSEIIFDFPIEQSSYSTDVSVIAAQNTLHPANVTFNNIDNIPSTSSNVQYLGQDSSLIENTETVSVPTIQSSTRDNTNV